MERRRIVPRGQSATEFALVATAFLMLVFGVVDTARAIYCYNTVCYAASTAIRYASLNGASSSSPATSSTIQTLVMSLATGLDATSTCPVSGGSALCATTTWSPNNSAGSTVKITVNYNFQPLAPFFSSAIIELSSSAQMVIPD
ncbi:MAG: TadE/TadG family type IV pilus assembly protein [Candidatus Binataceae bacterium]|jgi:Flp pilus assembly protein TadG